MYIGAEYKKLFNYILAHIIHNRIHKDSLKMESINKIQLDKYLIITEKIFSFIITGKLDNIGFNQWENEIISITNNYSNYYLVISVYFNWNLCLIWNWFYSIGTYHLWHQSIFTI
jgi:hypothetical protein